MALQGSEDTCREFPIFCIGGFIPRGLSIEAQNGANGAGGCLVPRDRGSRRSRADSSGQMAGHAQEAIQALKVETKNCTQ